MRLANITAALSCSQNEECHIRSCFILHSTLKTTVAGTVFNNAFKIQQMSNCILNSGSCPLFTPLGESSYSEACPQQKLVRLPIGFHLQKQNQKSKKEKSKTLKNNSILLYRRHSHNFISIDVAPTIIIRSIIYKKKSSSSKSCPTCIEVD